MIAQALFGSAHKNCPALKGAGLFLLKLHGSGAKPRLETDLDIGQAQVFYEVP